MKSNPILITLITLVAIAGLYFLTGDTFRRIAEPAFTVTQAEGNVQLRQYQLMTVAEVTMPGTRDQAMRDGFKILCDYIHNTAGKKIDKIAMMAPVLQQEVAPGSKLWQIRFIMPEGSSIKGLRQPTDSRVQLTALPSRKYAVISFSGRWTDANFTQNLNKLREFLINNESSTFTNKNLSTLGEPIYAFYNKPWTIPFWRRNEIMLQVTE